MSGKVSLSGTARVSTGSQYPIIVAADCTTEVQNVWDANYITFDLFEVSVSSQSEGGFCRPDTIIEEPTIERVAS